MPDDPRHGGGERGATAGPERLTDRLNRREADADDTRVAIAPFRDTFEARKVRRRAGSRAREKYQAQRKEWLRRNRLRFALLSALLAAVWLTLHLLVMRFSAPTHPTLAAWASGAIAGAAVMGIVLARQSPPSLIAKWQQGAWGEESTARKLAKLPRGRWDVLNDLGNGIYNFDHVLVGPAGVMCINSKWSERRLSVEGGSRVVFSERYDEDRSWSDDAIVRQARRDAFSLKQRIERQAGVQRLWVQPVIVWWGEFPDGVARVNDVDIVHGDKLVEWLAQCPPRGLKDQAAVVEALRP
ncbi:MAG TPA: nuclease-related domain-containing protein, partial [Coriobacteriia bacterium]|nr:nuclease-related domain-containing protein [Coriobacteriia bacterium]